ncbi:MAG: UDP-2,3-diacylglucosamine diphosphatase [Bacteroidales bacterium]|nr:UDP-2,3-diacylglucosamine diphosphatase [Bacteroidales bacterium]
MIASVKPKRRKVELVVISDVHLGTYGSQAYDLNQYLLGIKPDKLILNGDIIDFWQFSKRYWPNTHMKVVKSILNLAAKGCEVYYITGNHDETLRKFAGLRIGNFEIINKLELELNGVKTWFFHGDVFDIIMHNNKWLAKLGAMGYDALILINSFLNFVNQLFGRRKVSFSKKIKDNVKSAVKFIGDFENTAAKHAIQKGFQAIVIGHIHHPEMKEIVVPKVGHIQYLNSGDWVENLTSLEYNQGIWEIYRYPRDKSRRKEEPDQEDAPEELVDMDDKELFEQMVREFRQSKKA